MHDCAQSAAGHLVIRPQPMMVVDDRFGRHVEKRILPHEVPVQVVLMEKPEARTAGQAPALRPPLKLIAVIVEPAVGLDQLRDRLGRSARAPMRDRDRSSGHRPCPCRADRAMRQVRRDHVLPSVIDEELVGIRPNEPVAFAITPGDRMRPIKSALAFAEQGTRRETYRPSARPATGHAWRRPNCCRS